MAEQEKAPNRFDSVTNILQKDKSTSVDVNIEDQIEKALSNVIDANESKSRSLQKQSIKELKAVKDRIAEGGFEVDDKYNELISSAIESVNTSTKNNSNSMSMISDTLKNTLPSSDMIVGAITSQSPILGLLVNAVTGITNSFTKRREEAKAIADQEQKQLKEKFDLLKQEKSNVSDTAEMVKDEKDEDKGGPQAVDEIKPSVDEILNLNKESLDVLYDLYKLWGGTDKKIEEQHKTGIKQLQLAEDRIAEEKRAESLASKKSQLAEAKISPTAEVVDEDGGFMDGLKNLMPLASLLGAVSLPAIAGGIAAIVGIFSLIQIIPKFMEKFDNLGNILGKAQESLSIGEKIGGVIGIIAGEVLGFFNSVLNLFGVGVADEKMAEIKEGIIKFYANAYDGIVKSFQFIWDNLKQLFMDPTSFFGDITTSIYDSLSELKEILSESIKSAFTGLFGSIGDKIKGFFSDDDDEDDLTPDQKALSWDGDKNKNRRIVRQGITPEQKAAIDPVESDYTPRVLAQAETSRKKSQQREEMARQEAIAQQTMGSMIQQNNVSQTTSANSVTVQSSGFETRKADPYLVWD